MTAPSNPKRRTRPSGTRVFRTGAHSVLRHQVAVERHAWAGGQGAKDGAGLQSLQGGACTCSGAIPWSVVSSPAQEVGPSDCPQTAVANAHRAQSCTRLRTAEEGVTRKGKGEKKGQPSAHEPIPPAQGSSSVKNGEIK